VFSGKCVFEEMCIRENDPRGNLIRGNGPQENENTENRTIPNFLFIEYFESYFNIYHNMLFYIVFDGVSWFFLVFDMISWKVSAS
jgi:hypothetical protein